MSIRDSVSLARAVSFLDQNGEWTLDGSIYMRSSEALRQALQAHWPISPAIRKS